MAVAGLRLAYLGADVVICDPPGRSRTDLAHPGAVPRRWSAWSGGKRYAQPAEGDDFRRLLTGADVLLVGSVLTGQRDMASLMGDGALLVESDWEELPGELSAQAATGMLSYLGELGSEPVRIGWEAVTWAQGVLAAQAVLASCVSGRSVRGGRVRIPVMRTAATLISNQIIAHSSPDDWTGFAAYQWQDPEYGFRCSDGWLEIIFFRNDDAWKSFCGRIELPDLAADERFASYPARTNHKSELAAALEPALRRLPTAAVEELVEACGGMVAERRSLGRAVRDPQAEANGLIADGDTLDLASPWSICGHRTSVAKLDSPSNLDWHAPSHWRTGRSVAEESLTDLPLRGVTVADVTEGAQGPYAVSLLADLGATVVKVERPRGEFMRHVGPYRNGEALPFLALSHGRRLCWEVDLQSSSGRAAVAALAASCDVFVENWRPGTADRLGLGAEPLHRVNEKLVYVSASGFGSEGPMALKGALDQISQAASGLWSLSGALGGTPERFRGALLDYLSALVTTEGALVGLLARARKVPAVSIEVSQLSTALSTAQAELTLSPDRQQPRGSRSRHFCPSAAFRCSDGEWVVAEVTDDAAWSQIVADLDFPELAGPEFATNELRLEKEDLVYAQLEQRIMGQPSGHWNTAPRDKYLTLVVRPLADALRVDGILRERGHVVIEQSRVGEVFRVRPPWEGPAYQQLSESGPALGRDTSLLDALWSASGMQLPPATTGS